MSKTNQVNGGPRRVADEDAIAKRAYELYLQRGSVPGYELDDWLAAEAELTAASSARDGNSADDVNDVRQPDDGRRAPTRERTSPRRALRQ
jgi:hypothetical protein